jgi:hypothetical protein
MDDSDGQAAISSDIGPGEAGILRLRGNSDETLREGLTSPTRPARSFASNGH